MTKNFDDITMSERDFLLQQIGALKAQVSIYREWLMSLGAIQPPQIFKFDDKVNNKK